VTPSPLSGQEGSFQKYGDTAKLIVQLIEPGKESQIWANEYESRFEKDYGFLRPIIKEVVERYLDCGL